MFNSISPLHKSFSALKFDHIVYSLSSVARGGRWGRAALGGKIGVIAKKPGRKKHFEGAKLFGEGKKFLRGAGNNSGCKKQKKILGVYIKEKWGALQKKGHQKNLGKSSRKSLSIQKKVVKKILGYETKTSRGGKIKIRPGRQTP